MSFRILPILVLGLGSPVSAGLPLSPGQSISVRLGSGNDLRVLGARRAELADNDRLVIRQLVGTSCDTPQCAPVAFRDAAPISLPIRPSEIKFSFVTVEGKHSVLIIENGYSQAVTYRARIRKSGQEAPTDVCLVLPFKRGYEHWPYAIDKLTLSDVSLRRWSEGDAITCA
jgi:hypothetical protein